MKRRALISVSDKTNLIPFVEELVKLDFEIISTGGTKKVLDEAQIKTLAIDDVTGFPEMLDGRVKTLHPLVHGGLLAIRDNETHQKQVAEHDIHYIDLVCVNLYPFKETISKPNFTHEEAVENIDIGGPSMLRSAAKNHAYVSVVCDYKDYDLVIEEIKAYGDTTLATRQKLAAKVYRATASYDAMISEYMTNYVNEENPEKLTLTFDLKQTLRYGENPHQKASFYTTMKTMDYSLANAKQIHGKELSYNNIQDGNAALQILKEFKGQKAAIALKHMNPCGVGIGSTINEAFQKAYDADPISIFGGIVALSDEVNAELANVMSQIFLEIILAPGFTPEALDILTKKKNIRLMVYSNEYQEPYAKQFVSVSGGVLVQNTNDVVITKEQLTVVTKVEPTNQQIEDMLFGDKVVKHVKSNAIVVVKDGVTLGVGAGQMNRVGAAKIALEQAKEKAKGAVLASDAFFPMDDTVRLAAEYGISAIIQPGGSIRDKDSVEACDELGIAMVYSGTRHFKH